MARGQATSELLLILAAVLVVGLIVVALLMFYPGTSEEKQATASMSYWSNAQPIAIWEGLGGSTGTTGYVQSVQGFQVVLKNLGKEQIIVRGIDISGSDNVGVWRSSSMLPSSKQIAMGAGPEAYDCDGQSHSNHQCNFALNPGESIGLVLQPQSNPQCGEEGVDSINSLHKSRLVPVSIWYERNGVVQLEKGSVDLYVQCKDYRICGGTQDCEAWYGCVSQCSNGACSSGTCTN